LPTGVFGTHSSKHKKNKVLNYFPRLSLSNAENLNFEKFVELEITVNNLALDLICITEIQSQNLDTLKTAHFNEFIKLRHMITTLVKRVGGGNDFCRDNLSPRENVPGINEYDEIIWIKVNPKVLPHPLTNISVGWFYYSPGQKSEQRKDFLEKLHASLNYLQSKHPNAGILLTGDGNELNTRHLCREANLKQILNIPNVALPLTLFVQTCKNSIKDPIPSTHLVAVTILRFR